MPNLSNITIEGHVGRDAEMRQVGDKQVTSFSVAVTHKFNDKENTNWFNVSVWGKPAEWATAIKKGDAVHVSGIFEMREYDKKDGGIGTSLDIMARNFHKIAFEKKNDSAPSDGGGNDNDVPF